MILNKNIFEASFESFNPIVSEDESHCSDRGWTAYSLDVDRAVCLESDHTFATFVVTGTGLILTVDPASTQQGTG